MKGETVDELVGFARAMRQMAVPIDAGLDEGQTLLDTCGTGGDGANTFNISRLEERRVGQEGRSRWSPHHSKKKKKKQPRYVLDARRHMVSGMQGGAD